MHDVAAFGCINAVILLMMSPKTLILHTTKVQSFGSIHNENDVVLPFLNEGSKYMVSYTF